MSSAFKYKFVHPAKKRKAWQLLRNDSLTPLMRCFLRIITQRAVRHVRRLYSAGICAHYRPFGRDE